MRGLTKRRRLQMVAAAAICLMLAAVMLGYAFREGIQFFRTPTQVTENPPDPRETFRIGGLVETGSVLRQGSAVHFRVTDGARSVPVSYTGITPDLFREGEGVIATGRLVSGVVQASEVLARHDEDYMPRELTGMSEAGVTDY